MRAFAFLAVASAALVSAQTAAQNSTAAALAAQIPACVLPCDDAAIKSVGCGLTDYACHCAHGAQLAKIIPACIKANATSCTPADLTLFASLPPKICAALNSTTSTVTGTAASVGTILPTGGAGGVNSTVISTASASASTYGPSTVTSTNVQSATNMQTATNVPTGPTTTSSAPAPSKTNGAAANGVATGLLALLGAGVVGIAL